jgi:hypothetical protein
MVEVYYLLFYLWIDRSFDDSGSGVDSTFLTYEIAALTFKSKVTNKTRRKYVD